MREHSLHEGLFEHPLELRQVSHPVPQIPGLELLEEVGRGARNVVYRARCRGRQVALKIPRLALAESESLALDYRKEASLQARVSHANLPEGTRVVLSDLYPNSRAFQRIADSHPDLQHFALPLDVCHIPEHLPGTRTLFTALHHL